MKCILAIACFCICFCASGKLTAPTPHTIVWQENGTNTLGNWIFKNGFRCATRNGNRISYPVKRQITVMARSSDVLAVWSTNALGAAKSKDWVVTN